MENLIPLGTFFLGYALARHREIRGYFISKKLQARNEPQAPVSRILKPFTTAPKRKPRVNDDQKAWLAEKTRTE
jgi:hypothetical protein